MQLLVGPPNQGVVESCGAESVQGRVEHLFVEHFTSNLSLSFSNYVPIHKVRHVASVSRYNSGLSVRRNLNKGSKSGKLFRIKV